jgi:hypothetical protein
MAILAVKGVWNPNRVGRRTVAKMRNFLALIRSAAIPKYNISRQFVLVTSKDGRWKVGGEGHMLELTNVSTPNAFCARVDFPLKVFPRKRMRNLSALVEFPDRRTISSRHSFKIASL